MTTVVAQISIDLSMYFAIWQPVIDRLDQMISYAEHCRAFTDVQTAISLFSEGGELSMSGDVFAFWRFTIVVLLIIGGGVAIVFGYRLFKEGAGLKGIDKIDAQTQLGKISIAGMSVGGTAMVTSVFWAFFAYLSVPELELASNVTRITKSDKLPVSNEYPSVGTRVVANDKKSIGTITEILMDDKLRPKGYVVTGTASSDLLGSAGKSVLIDSRAVDLGPDGKSAMTGLSQSDIGRLIK